MFALEETLGYKNVGLKPSPTNLGILYPLKYAEAHTASFFNILASSPEAALGCRSPGLVRPNPVLCRISCMGVASRPCRASRRRGKSDKSGGLINSCGDTCAKLHRKAPSGKCKVAEQVTK